MRAMKVNVGGIPPSPLVGGGAPSTDLDHPVIDLSESIPVGTRKMVNYA